MREKGGARTAQLGSGGQDLSLVQIDDFWSPRAEVFC